MLVTWLRVDKLQEMLANIHTEYLLLYYLQMPKLLFIIKKA